MKSFFANDILLDSDLAVELYNNVKDLPIIDYHCHLNQKEIKDNSYFDDIGKLWLEHDHYKWRAMRLCGIEEKYITGNASWKDKFLKYASIMPKLVGNPLYYWSHFELKNIFNIDKALNENTAREIYESANAIIKKYNVQALLNHFNVRYIATTDDPCDLLDNNGQYGDIVVAPTFRPDEAFNPHLYCQKLERCIGKKITTSGEYVVALEKRLDFFVKKNCKISDHGFYHFPTRYIDDITADELFLRRESLTSEEQNLFFGWLLVKLAKMYAKKNITMQIHFGVVRNCNNEMYQKCGKDAGFDLIGETQSPIDIINFLNQLGSESPSIVLYTLNDSNLKQIATITGAFRNVKMGAAWWFNDTVEGIKNNLSVICEYSALGDNLGMLTDSRSFASYCRFDFYRRILCNFIADKINKGEYDLSEAKKLLQNICYDNAREMVGL